MRTFLVVGHLGAPNVGDEAMLAGLLSRCPSDVRFIISSSSVLGGARVDPRHVFIARTLRSQIASVRRVSGVVLCGGTHLHDSFIGIRLAYHYASILRYCLLFAYARCIGRSVHLLAIGAGPTRRRSARLLTRVTMLLATTVSSRDGAGAAVLARCAPTIPVKVGFDLAVLCVPRGQAKHPQATLRRRLGISVGPLSEGELEVGDWMVLAEAVRAVSRKTDLEVVLFVFAGQEPGSDRAVVRALEAALTTEQTSLIVTVVDCPGDVYKTTDELRECDAVIASRYHSSVLAYSTRVPQLIFAYHEKSRQFAFEVGLPSIAVAQRRDTASLKDGISQMLFEDNAQFLGTLPLEAAAERASTLVDEVLADDSALSQ